MDAAKTLAAGLAVNRTLFGANYLIKPKQARISWIGRAARKPGAQVMIRSQGIRDVALGAGALRALARGDARELRAWVAGHTVCDLADLAATWAARGDLPASRARQAMAIAAVSTLGDAALLVAHIEDLGPVVGADVVALAVLGRRVVDLEEELQDVPV